VLSSLQLYLESATHPPSTTFPATLAYTTHGSPSNPAILLPSCFGGKLASTTPFLYNASACQNPSSTPPIPSSKYFIIITALLGNGESSSPSNPPSDEYAGPNFPKVTYEDNIHLQHALCQHLGIKKLFLYTGFSMGGQQTYHMSVLYPNFVERMAVIAGSARTSWHNYSFLEGPKAALLASEDFHDGKYKEKGVVCNKGTRAFGRVYSTWALDQEWFRQKCWEREESGKCASLEEYLKTRWEGGLGAWDANDLLCLLWTWQNGDISVYNKGNSEGKGERGVVREGDLKQALDKIKAMCLIMPSRTDTYFPPRDSELEVEMFGEIGKKAKLVVIPSIFGHLAGGGGGSREDERFLCEQIGRFIEETT